MNKNLSVTGILQESWKMFSANLSYVYYLFVPMFVVSFIGTLAYAEPLSYYSDSAHEVNLPLLLIGTVLWILSGIVGIFATISVLFFVQSGKKDTWKEWKQYFVLLPKFIGVSILYALMVLAGLILLVLPGIYIAVRYAFVGYRTLEHPTESVKNLFKAEASATEGNRLTIFLIGLFVIFISAVTGGILSSIFSALLGHSGSSAADFIAQIIITPFTTIMSIVTYRQLTAKAKSEPDPIGTGKEKEKITLEKESVEAPLIPPAPVVDPVA